METIQIECGNGFKALIDEADETLVAPYKWNVGGRKRPYAQSTMKVGDGWRNTLMHRYLLDAPHGVYVDHVNGNTLDNRRSNLRLATPKQNAQHRTRSTTGKYLGVTATGEGKWKAAIFPNTGAIYLGTYLTEEEAAAAYNAAARLMAGQFAGINNVPDVPGILDRLIAEKRAAIARLSSEISALTGSE